MWQKNSSIQDQSPPLDPQVIADYTSRLNSIKDQIKSAEAQREEISNGNSELLSKKNDDLNALIDKVSIEKKELYEKNAKLTAAIIELDKKEGNFLVKEQEFTKKVEEFKSFSGIKDNELKNFEIDLKNQWNLLNKDKNELGNSISKHEETKSRLNVQFDSLNAREWDIAERLKAVEDREAQCLIKENTIASAMIEIKNRKEFLESKEQSLKSKEEEISITLQDVVTYNDALTRQKNEINSSTIANRKSKYDAAEKIESLKQIEKNIDAKMQELKRLEEQLAKDCKQGE